MSHRSASTTRYSRSPITSLTMYLGSTVTSNLSLDTGIDKRITKATAVLSKLSKRAWNNNQLTLNTKLKVYQACVLSTLLYVSESWTTYAQQENRLESFHLHCLRRIMGITWQDKVFNAAMLKEADSLSMHLLLCKRRLQIELTAERVSEWQNCPLTICHPLHMRAIRMT